MYVTLEIADFLTTVISLQTHAGRTAQFCWYASIHYAKLGKLFSTRLLSSCTDEYAHTYDISTYSSTAVIVCVRVKIRVRVRVLLTCCPCAHSSYIHWRNMQTPCRKRVDRSCQCCCCSAAAAVLWRHAASNDLGYYAAFCAALL